MLNNFEFLKGKKEFESFSRACVEAEEAILISPSNCAMSCRRALELSVKWLYSFDRDLKLPYQDKLSSLIHDPSFKNIVDEELISLMKYIVRLGNASIHTNINISREEAIVSLHNLYQVVAWIDYCYAEEYSATEFNELLVKQGENKRTDKEELNNLYNDLASKDKKIEKIIKENEELRKKLTNRRIEQEKEYNFNVDKLNEEDTRKIYINLDLKLAGWNIGNDAEEEFPVDGMPNASGKGSVDYVLWGDNGKPLAVVEAKKTSYSSKKGIHQAKLYADSLEKRFKQRPVIFLSNGYDIHLLDDYNNYPVRRVYGIFTKDQLQRMIDRRANKKSLKFVDINNDISNRPYQKMAINSVCKALEDKERSMLLVMATGTGKTYTAFQIVYRLLRSDLKKRILYLADRNILVDQSILQDFAPLEKTIYKVDFSDKECLNKIASHEVNFALYHQMVGQNDEEHFRQIPAEYFDLIIVDECHRGSAKEDSNWRKVLEYFSSATKSV